MEMHMMSVSKTSTAASKRPGTEAVSLARMRRAPTHPGEVFEEEFRKPSGLSQAEAARRMGMSTNRLNEIVAGKRGVTAETAILFGAITTTDPRMWLHMQADYDIWEALRQDGSPKVNPLAVKIVGVGGPGVSLKRSSKP